MKRAREIPGDLELRQTVALEKIGNCLSTISDVLLSIVDGNTGVLKMRDVERAKVYSEHLGKKLR